MVHKYPRQSDKEKDIKATNDINDYTVCLCSKAIFATAKELFTQKPRELR